jgi:hypothetical protein
VADEVLEQIEGLLGAGLVTQWRERAYTSEDVNNACRRLQALAADDVQGRLVLAGFTTTPYVAPDDTDQIEQSCATCMYFERHREFCALPELMLPVRPQWSCVLWRI